MLEMQDLADSGLHVVHLATPIAEESLVELGEAPEIAYVGHVFQNPVSQTNLVLTDRVVVKLAPGRTIADLDAAAASYGAEVKDGIYGTTDEFVLEIPDAGPQTSLDVANALTDSPHIAWAQPDFIQDYALLRFPNDPRFVDQWHLENRGQRGGSFDADVDASLAWDVTTGSADVTIAVLDDGVEFLHEDLAANAFRNPGELPGNGIDDDGNGLVDDVSGWDFRDGDNDPRPVGSNSCFDEFAPADCHGQAVAGVAAATGDNGTGVTGICQRCRILPVRIVGPQGFASDATIGSALRYAASLADILSNSWGAPPGVRSAPLESAIADAAANGRGGRGAPVLFASGNSADPADAYIPFELSGFPAGVVTVLFVYSKDSFGTAGDDTVRLDNVRFPGGGTLTFENGRLPAGCTTGFSTAPVPWRVVTDPLRAHAGQRFAQAGRIGHGDLTVLACTREVSAGTLTFDAWVSSEFFGDFFDVFVDINGVLLGPFFEFSGVPRVFVGQVAHPANQPGAWAIGASTNRDERARYSQFGPALFAVAPSNGGSLGVTTTDRTGAPGYDRTSYTTTFGGTSSATPLAAGIVGLMLSRDPNQTRDALAAQLRDGTDRIGPRSYPAGRNDEYGYGRLNAAAALGVTPPGEGSAALGKCQDIMAKAGVRFVDKAMKRLAKCDGAVFACIQTKVEGEKRDKCIAKAVKRCRKELDAIQHKEQAAGERAVLKKCQQIPVSELLSEAGFGFARFEAECADAGQPLDDARDVTSCSLTRQHCLGERLVGLASARVRELTTQLPGAPVLGPQTCLVDRGGFLEDIDDESGEGKLLQKCVQELKKSGRTFVVKTLKGLHKCLRAVRACSVKKQGDVTCARGASAKCDKELAKLTALRQKQFGSRIDKKCGAEKVAFATLTSPLGAHIGALTDECEQVATSTASLTAFEECLSRQHQCLAERLLQYQAPRAEQALATVDRDLVSPFCPAEPTVTATPTPAVTPAP